MSDEIARANWQNDWGLPETAAGCPHCDWLYLVPPAKLPLRCPHCGQAELTAVVTSAVDRDQLPHTRPPEMLVPFSISQPSLVEKIQAFAKQIPFAPEDLKPDTLLRRLQPVFLPMWLVDSQVKAFWQAEAGFNYQVVSHREHYGAGQWRTQEVEETRVRWEPRVGQLERKYDNVAVPALKEHDQLLSRLGGYHMEAAVNYDPRSLGEGLVRLPNRAPQAAWPAAVAELQNQARDDCQRAAGADHIRSYRWSATYPEQNWTQLLLPLYATYYHDDEGQPQIILINGQRGGISGQRRASMKRAQRTALLIALVATIIAAVGIVLGVAGIFLPPLLVVAIIFLVLAFLVGAGTIYPIFTVWQFNRSHAKKTN